MLKLLVFGSSLARDLASFDKKRVHKVYGKQVKFIYRFFPGKSFEHFLEKRNRWKINDVLKCKPDFICVIFGGNSIKMGINWDDVLVSCRNFYQLLFDRFMSFNPRGKIIASQVILRFNRNPNNRFRCPDPDTFRSFRNLINRKLNKLRSRHHMLIVAGRNNLDDESLFLDGTHLNVYGQEIQFHILVRTLAHVISLQNPPSFGARGQD